MKSQEELAAEWEASLLAQEDSSGPKPGSEESSAQATETSIPPIDKIVGTNQLEPSLNTPDLVRETVESAPLAPRGVLPPRSAGRDMTVPALLNLMGLPTAGSIEVLEKKVDILSSKLAALTAKLDRLSAHMTKAVNESYLDRIDYQLSDLRSILKTGKASESSEFRSPGVVAGDSDEDEVGEHQLSLSSVPDESTKE